jgi:parallel beta-helix repeat protein
LVVGPGVRIDFTPAARSERNGQFGIFLQGAGGNAVEANTTSHNGVDGISLQRAVRACVNYDATDNVVVANVAAGNGRYGIFADAFAVENTFGPPSFGNGNQILLVLRRNSTGDQV